MQGEKIPYKFKRRTKEEIDSLPIEDGSIIFDTTNKEILMDNGSVRENYSGGGSGGGSVETDTTLTQSGKPADAKVVGDKINENKENINLITEPNYYKNLNNPQKTERGYIENTNGNVVAHDTYFCTDFIPVIKDCYYITAARGVHSAFYKDDKTYDRETSLSYSNDLTNLNGKSTAGFSDGQPSVIFKSPIDGFIRCTLLNEQQKNASFRAIKLLDDFTGDLERYSDEYTSDYIQPKGLGEKVSVNQGAENNGKLLGVGIDGNISPVVVDNILYPFSNVSKNLANPKEFTEDKYMTTGGIISSNVAYFFTGKIPVKEGDTIYGNADFRVVTAFNKNHVAQPSLGKENVSPGDGYKVPAGVRYIVLSVRKTHINDFMVSVGSILNFVPYGKFKILEEYLTIDEQAKSLCGLPPKIGELTSLNANVPLEYNDFPLNLKKGFSISFGGSFTTFTNLLVGKGLNSYRGCWFDIDNTNIVRHVYDSSADVTKETVPHKLTIKNFIKVFFTLDDNSNCLISIVTDGGTFSTKFNWWYEGNGKVFAKSSTDMTNVRLNAMSKDFQKPLWLFGDSYFGVSKNRILGSLKQYGYFNFLADGLAGQNSNGAYQELLRCLNYGTPKYLIWCLGMNDSGLQYYKPYLDQLIGICKTHNILLKVVKIPSVPNRPKEEINQYIESSNIPYIDWYSAVGSQVGGTWTDGYLDTDKVHPTPMGANVLSSQMLIDAPEIMQYGYTDFAGILDNITGDK